MKGTNFIGLYTLIYGETRRFLKDFLQTVVAPTLTILLFMVVFILAFQADERAIGSISYTAFLAPGLVMMMMISAAFGGAAGSLMTVKGQGTILDILMAPLSTGEIMLGFVIPGILKGLITGLAGTAMVMMFVDIPLNNIPAIALFSVLGLVFMSLLGFILGLYSDKPGYVSALHSLVIFPLTFLSGTFYSIHVLPLEWQAIILANPLFFVIDGFRYGFTGYTEGALGKGILMLLIYNVGLFIFAYASILAGFKSGRCGHG